MNKIIFTICSNNYLAQAKTLGDSVLEFCPDYTFVIILCDKKNAEIDYSVYSKFELLEADNINVETFAFMLQNYSIVELNTAIKPFCFEYLYNSKKADSVIYLDPDTCLYAPLAYIEEKLSEYDIILTPHILTPLEFDGHSPDENTFTQFGIYNLGFLATKASENTQKLLVWWKNRLSINCYNEPTYGVFVDQLPMNYAPVFFEKVYVSKNKGLNAAPWNLHERNIHKENDKWCVEENTALLFYHFSNCKYNEADNLSTIHTRFGFENNAILKEFYNDYKQKVLGNNYNKLSKIAFAYQTKINKRNRPFIKHTPTIKVLVKYLKKYPLFFLRKDFWV